jgi:transcriptional regulator with XRE-family HTH domain
MVDSPIPKRLKEARKAAKLSQKKLGIAAGMDEFSASARLNHYEKGRHTPDYSMLKRIANVLKLPVAYFYAESDELAQWIQLFNKIKKSKRLALLK